VFIRGTCFILSPNNQSILLAEGKENRGGFQKVANADVLGFSWVFRISEKILYAWRKCLCSINRSRKNCVHKTIFLFSINVRSIKN
jgi:hypothetical protein